MNVNEAPTNTGLSATNNLLSNGSFESGSSSWTFTGAATTTTSQGVTEGTTSLVFSTANTANNGVASQSIATVIGNTYTVQFDMGAFANSSGIDLPQMLNFKVQGATVLVNETMADSGTTPNTFGSYRYTFVADSTTTTLTFADASNITTNVNVVVDNVRMFDVATSTPASTIAENSSNGHGGRPSRFDRSG